MKKRIDKLEKRNEGREERIIIRKSERVVAEKIRQIEKK